MAVIAISLWPLPAAAQPPFSEQEQRELQSRLEQKMQRLQQALQRWQQAQQLLQQFESRMQAGRPQEAEGLLDQALALVAEEASPPPASADALRRSAPTRVTLTPVLSDAEIVYLASATEQPLRAPGAGVAHIFVMDATGTQVTQITFDNPRRYEHAAVSPDRTKIVATASTGEAIQLWLFDIKKGTEAELAPLFITAGVGGVDWSLDSEFIYFAALEKESGFQNIYKIRPDGAELTKLTSIPDGAPGFQSDLSVSEDGTLITYVRAVPARTPSGELQGKTQIWVMNSDGSNQRMVDDGGGEVGMDTRELIGDYDPELSPNNAFVVFSRTNTKFKNFPKDANTAHDLWIAPNGGKGPVKRITPEGPISIIPDWKDDLIVYTEISEKDNYRGASIIKSDGTGYRKLKVGAMSPKWIPAVEKGVVRGPIPQAAGKIAFVSNRDGDDEIFVMSPDGTEVAQLTSNTAKEDDLSWSPDGTTLIFRSERDGDSALYVMHADGSNPTRLSPAPGVDAAAGYSPDGTKIVFVSRRDGQPDIYVMNADGTNPQRLTFNAGRPELAAQCGAGPPRTPDCQAVKAFGFDPRAIDFAPVFSPDGSKILFWSLRDGDQELFLMNADSSQQRQLTFNDVPDGEAGFTPDGKKIFFARAVHGVSQIFEMNLDGSHQRQLTHFTDHAGDMSLSPDGTRMVLQRNSGGNAEVWIMDVDGSNPVRTGQPCSIEACSPRWQPVHERREP